MTIERILSAAEKIRAIIAQQGIMVSEDEDPYGEVWFRKVGEKVANELKEDMDDLFSEQSHVLSSVIFFLPGTRQAVPIHFYKQNVAKDHKKLYEGLTQRIDQIQDVWRYDDESKKHSHLFFAMRALHGGTIPQLKEQTSKVFFSAERDICVHRSSVVVAGEPNLIENEGFLLAASDETSFIFPWKKQKSKSKTAACSGYTAIVSPVIGTTDVFVCFASYLKGEMRISDGIEEDKLRGLIALHATFATSAFAPLYAYWLGSDAEMLRAHIEDRYLTGNLLSMAASSLRPSFENDDMKNRGISKNFTYVWFQKEESSNGGRPDSVPSGSRSSCADIRGVLHDEATGDFDRLPQRTIKIFWAMRLQLAREWEKIGLTSLLDTDAPHVAENLRELLRNVEIAQRSLKTTKRDHVFHQLQVLLLGTLYLNKQIGERDEKVLNYLLAIPEDGDPKGGDDSELWDQVKLKGATAEQKLTLLRCCWFLTSTLHDIGYPVQAVDGVVDSLRNRIFELLDIAATSGNWQLSIAHALYDNPKTYVLLREFTRACVHIVNGSVNDETNFEKLWFFLRRYAFDKKHHSVISALVIIQILAKELSSEEEIADWFKKAGLFWTRHVFMPIAFHHIYDWYEEFVRKEIDSSNGSKLTKTYLKEVMRWEESGDDIVPVSDVIKLQRIAVSSPITALLLTCDHFQEDGRPSGKAKEYWPRIKGSKVVSSEIDEKPGVSLCLELEYPHFDEGNGWEGTKDQWYRKQDDEIYVRLCRYQFLRHVILKPVDGLSSFVYMQRLWDSSDRPAKIATTNVCGYLGCDKGQDCPFYKKNQTEIDEVGSYWCKGGKYCSPVTHEIYRQAYPATDFYRKSYKRAE